MSFTDRILSLHPALITISFLALFALSGAIMFLPLWGDFFFLTFSLAMPVLFVPLMIWHYSLYRAASDRGAKLVGHSGKRGKFFLLTTLGLGGVLILLPVYELTEAAPHTSDALKALFGASLTVGNLSYFASIWAASNALVRFEEQSKSPEFHKALGTFFLEFYLPLGIWALHPRIKRLLEEPAPG